MKANLFLLDYYSGETPVLLPKSNSPVINAGDSTVISSTDQRGLPRLVGRKVDIGAVETNYAVTATLSTPQTTVLNTPFASPLQARITESGRPVAGDSLFFQAPSNGVSGTFPGLSLTAIAVSGSTGLASFPYLLPTQ